MGVQIQICCWKHGPPSVSMSCNDTVSRLVTRSRQAEWNPPPAVELLEKECRTLHSASIIRNLSVLRSFEDTRPHKVFLYRVQVESSVMCTITKHSLERTQLYAILSIRSAGPAVDGSSSADLRRAARRVGTTVASSKHGGVAGVHPFVLLPLFLSVLPTPAAMV